MQVSTSVVYRPPSMQGTGVNGTDGSRPATPPAFSVQGLSSTPVEAMIQRYELGGSVVRPFTSSDSAPGLPTTAFTGPSASRVTESPLAIMPTWSVSSDAASRNSTQTSSK